MTNDSSVKWHAAPWSRLLIGVSASVSVLCLGLGIGFITSGVPTLAWASVVPLLLVAGSALFTIRGYTVTPEALLVHRLLWKTRVPLTGLQSARIEPDAMRWSLRLFGNGGLFSFSGWYRNKALGTYRAWVTDPGRTVVLRYGTRTVVVSPSEPEAFVVAVVRGGNS